MAAERFAPDVLSVLRHVGWSPRRDVSTAVEAWLERDAAALTGVSPSAAALAFLSEFGGLTLLQWGHRRTAMGNGFNSHVYPVADQLWVDTTIAVAEEDGLDLFPVGYTEDDAGELAMQPNGRMIMLHWSGRYLVGETPDEAVSQLILGDPWVSC